jgi:putative iron-dependent peroxidase
MGRPQSVIVHDTWGHVRLVVLRTGATGVARATRVAAALPRTLAAVAALDAGVEVAAAIGFGDDFWDVISPAQRPRALGPFPAMAVGPRSAPATGGDMLLHVGAARADLAAEVVRRFMAALAGTVTVLEDVYGFRYLDGRDLTGFIDGTENPEGDARAAATLIGDEDPTFAGGSYVFTQRYVHALDRWHGVSEADQEGILGRRKRDSEELPDDIKPPTAHISRVVIEEDGAELEIMRHSCPYVTATEAGLFFIAYTRDLAIPERMLGRMVGTADDGRYDHLLDYTRAVSGATFFAPALDVLTALA